MSRNKDIKYYHAVTGKSYSECRRDMKRWHWNLNLALAVHFDCFKAFLDCAADCLNRIAEAMSEYLTSAAEAASETFARLAVNLNSCGVKHEAD